MKKLYPLHWLIFFASLLAFHQDTKAQYVTIPDSNFANYLRTNFPAAMNGNQLDTTNSLVTRTTVMSADQKSLRDITGIQYFDSLLSFSCSSNAITFLPALPPLLANLHCPGNGIQNLGILPPNLRELDCRINSLVTLTPLPQRLFSLDCSYNNLIALPILPDSLEVIHCENNQLTNLPQLPRLLRFLMCSRNSLTTLPPLPATLNSIYAENNKFTSLPPLPAVMQAFEVNTNPKLHCMPPGLERLTTNTFNISQTAITCLPNRIAHSGIFLYLDTIPICDPLNIYGCFPSHNITGLIYKDDNADCRFQPDIEPQLPVKLNLYRGNSNKPVSSAYFSYGSYSFKTDTGTYRVEVDSTALPFKAVCPLSGDTLLTVTSVDSMHSRIDFGLECKPGADVAAFSASSSRLRPASIGNIYITAGDVSSFYDANCHNRASGMVTVIINGPFSYIGPVAGAKAPDIINGKTLTWNISNFDSTHYSSDYSIFGKVDSTATRDSVVCIVVVGEVTPGTSPNNRTNDTIRQCFIIRTSYDPNDKEVYPDGDIDETTKWLTYTVRFQNTGNDTALSIYILDTLDAAVVDPSTFQLLTTSHKSNTQINGNIIRFDFPAIYLPDSNVNEPASHGYLQYKVRLNDNLPIGTQIKNSASIYFDLNAPVLTNTTVNTIALNTAIINIDNNGPQVNVYPNPNSTGSWHLIVDKELIGSQMEIFDISGKLVFNSAISNQNSAINLTVSPGIYLLKISSGYNIVRKLVKL